MAYKHPIDLNVLPHIDVFLENGYTKEEMKMVNEHRKILGDDSIRLTSTTVSRAGERRSQRECQYRI
jgi:aspartate-semialdehyde dehydrogenase